MHHVPLLPFVSDLAQDVKGRFRNFINKEIKEDLNGDAAFTCVAGGSKQNNFPTIENRKN